MHCFLKLLTNKINICNIFTMDDVLVVKVNISASLKKINFPKISEQAPLRLCKIIVYKWIDEPNLHSWGEHVEYWTCSDCQSLTLRIQVDDQRAIKLVQGSNSTHKK